MNRPLEQLHTDIILTAKKGYPILLSGAIVFFVFAFMPLIFPRETVYLIWIFGLTAIFPFGLLLSKLFGVNIMAVGNPLGTLGGMVAAPQVFYIPVFIVVYMHMPDYLPFTIGLLGGSHFLPYMWIYKSRAYLVVTLGICLSSLIFGSFFIEQAFTFVPLAIVAAFGTGVLLIFQELKISKSNSPVLR